MTTVSKSLRLPAELAEQIERELARTGVKEWSAGVLQLLVEALRMRRAPGIVFADSPAGRCATIAGTGIAVWEVISASQSLGGDFARLRASYEWLSEAQLRAALSYYAGYPEEINGRLALEEQWTPDGVRQELPFAWSTS